MNIQYNVFEEHINQMLLWKIAWLRLRCSIKLKNDPNVYLVTARGFGDNKLVVEDFHGKTFSVKEKSIERINIPASQR